MRLENILQIQSINDKGSDLKLPLYIQFLFDSSGF